ncbi:tetratricopeptide repeat protein [Streptomyces sp. SBT349]|uniref:tetratricopeptide repeat protein n=1 Tax=Streptomyces sp. SBT349 TaxID=1580539 RepID=UPI00066E70BB|nr:tetratricopeptide repeat protein [Streptomyces sp. SBT349]
MENAIVRVRQPSGEVAGTGFLVGADLICTCAHVVANGPGHDGHAPQPPDLTVPVDFPLLPAAAGAPRPVIEADVVAWTPEQPDGAGDVALLRLRAPAPPGARPVRLTRPGSTWGDRFRVLGFPNNRDLGVWAAGELRGTQAAGWIQMEVTQGPRITRGFSGAPVWDLSAQGVVGMVVAAERAEGTAYLIPTESLLSAAPGMLTGAAEDANYPEATGHRTRDGVLIHDRDQGNEEPVGRSGGGGHRTGPGHVPVLRGALGGAATGGGIAGVACGLYLLADAGPSAPVVGFAVLAGATAGTFAAWQRAQGTPRRGTPPHHRTATGSELDRVLVSVAARSGVLLAESERLWAMPRFSLPAGERGSMSEPQPGDEQASALTAPTTLFHLPPTVSDFTGRENALASVRDTVLGAGEHSARAVLISAVAGKAGVGKTTLAVQAAHELRPHFPDGQLYVNLRGAEAQRVHPADALAEFLRGLGVEGSAIPAGLDERGRLYRDRLAGRRVLVVLDNAADEAQVRPLLPGASGCAVIVTSRSLLAGLEGVRSLVLDVLPPEDAVALLGRVAGADRVAREPEAALRVARLCGFLPLAVRIAGARLASRPHWGMSSLGDLLADEESRLAELEIGDLGVRASFRLSVRELDAGLERLFRMLGLLEAPDFPAWVAAPLLDTGPARAASDIERLVDAQLLEVAGTDAAGQTRYRFHDLIRVYAREELRAYEPPPVRAAALRGVVETYLSSARLAVDGLEPEGLQTAWRTAVPAWPTAGAIAEAAVADPLVWFQAERLSLVSAVEQAVAELPELAWELTAELATFFDLHTHWDDWENTQALALTAAERAGSGTGAGYTLWSVIRLRRYQSRFADAIAAAERCLGVFRATGDLRGEAAALVDLARVFWYQARFEEAAASADRCLRIFEELQDRRWTARTRVDLGDVRRDQGRFAEAEEHCTAAHRAFDRLGDPRWTAIALVALGRVERDSGRPREAIARFEAGVAAFRELGDRIWENYTLRCLGDALRDLGRLEEALESLDPVVPAFAKLGDRRWQMRSLHSLGEVHRELGNHSLATSCYLTCLPAFQESGDRLWEAKTLAGLGRLAVPDERAEAAVLWRASLAILREIGSPEAALVAGWLGEADG